MFASAAVWRHKTKQIRPAVTTNNCWGYEAANEMFDDGLHGDDAVNDGVWGAWVTCHRPTGRHEGKRTPPLVG